MLTDDSQQVTDRPVGDDYRLPATSTDADNRPNDGVRDHNARDQNWYKNQEPLSNSSKSTEWWLDPMLRSQLILINHEITLITITDLLMTINAWRQWHDSVSHVTEQKTVKNWPNSSSMSTVPCYNAGLDVWYSWPINYPYCNQLKNQNLLISNIYFLNNTLQHYVYEQLTLTRAGHRLPSWPHDLIGLSRSIA